MKIRRIAGFCFVLAPLAFSVCFLIWLNWHIVFGAVLIFSVFVGCIWFGEWLLSDNADGP